MLKIVLFFVFAIGVGFPHLFRVQKWSNRHKQDHRRFVVAAFVICLLMSFARRWFGVADITGAFIAGLLLSQYQVIPTSIASRFETLSLYAAFTYFLCERRP